MKRRKQKQTLKKHVLRKTLLYCKCTYQKELREQSEQKKQLMGVQTECWSSIALCGFGLAIICIHTATYNRLLKATEIWKYDSHYSNRKKFQQGSINGQLTVNCKSQSCDICIFPNKCYSWRCTISHSEKRISQTHIYPPKYWRGKLNFSFIFF